MIKSLLIVFVFIFAVSGFAEFLHSLRLALCRPNRKKRIFSVVMLKKGEAVNQLNFVVAQRKWLGSFYADEIIAIDTQLDEEERKRCKFITEDGNVLICPIDALGGAISSICEQRK